jgi:predicted acyltransferase
MAGRLGGFVAVTGVLVPPSEAAERAPFRETRAAPDAPGPVPGTSAPRASRERLLSLDVFRGMTVAGMLLVNNPGTWSAIYPPLEHAEWNGWTPTDLIFPFFLFIAGITTQLSMGARRARGDDDTALLRQIVRRGFLIFLFGFAMSAFPGWQWGPASEWAPALGHAPSFLDRFFFRWEHVRFLGVLPRIGIAYATAALLTFRGSLKTHVMIAVGLLFGYWFAMTLIPVPGHGMGALMLDTKCGNLAAYLDRAILGLNHIWIGGTGPDGKVCFDPEGPMSTIPAIATAILGGFAGRWIASKRSLMDRIAGLFAVGAIAMMAGLMWNWSFPINKSLWTSSYVLFTAGMACVAIATCMWVIDVMRVKWWTAPFEIYGLNPMIAFVGSGVMARCIYSIWHVTLDGQRVSLVTAIYETVYLRPLGLEPRNASLLFAVTFVLFWMVILGILRQRRIVFKV